MNNNYELDSYDYSLPSESIAQTPTLPHHNAKLLVCEKQKNGSYSYHNKIFYNIADILDEKDILFFNDTKVIKTRIPLQNVTVHRHSGFETLVKRGEIFLYTIIDDHHFEALVSDDKNFKAGSQIFLDSNILKVKKLTSSGVLFELIGSTLDEFLEQYAQLPLPPYITYAQEKEQRYQTIFSKHAGSAAAPTASLHFTKELLQKLAERDIQTEFLTLHIGLGTFKPILTKDISRYDIHSEQCSIPIYLFSKIAQYKQQKKNIVPVGTTMIRTLESLPLLYNALCTQGKQDILELSTEETKFWENKSSENINEKIRIIDIDTQQGRIAFDTKIYIYPGYSYTIIDKIITNFHIPKSSLMVMISARMGRENILTTYQYAIENDYRFYSFGDAMLIQ